MTEKLYRKALTGVGAGVYQYVRAKDAELLIRLAKALLEYLRVYKLDSEDCYSKTVFDPGVWAHKEKETVWREFGDALKAIEEAGE